MPLYMHQWSYKGEQIKQLLLEKADRSEVVRVAIEAFGGTLRSFFYCLGKYDGLAISEFPDSESALASVLAISAQGRINFIHTTALFSPEEGLKAMRNAGEVIGSRPPPATP
ncbi:MAG: hypothetical protein JWO52_3899 [Gammaproteobacteria bacterium]|jgi:uncharacterized protein with GYD domain|nr:hypothetical protein [Gammaproteobacteria bacterium]